MGRLSLEQVEKIAAEEVYASEAVLDDVVRFLARRMQREQIIDYAIRVSEDVLYIYEQSHPDDDRPRKAIQAAGVCLMNRSKCRDASETACMAAKAARAVTSENMAAFHAGQAAAAAAAVAGWLFWSRRATPEAVHSVVKVVQHASEAFSAKLRASKKEMMVNFINTGLDVLDERPDWEDHEV